MLQGAWTIFFKNEYYEKKILGFMKFHGIEIIIVIIKQNKTKQNKTKMNGLFLNPCILQIEVNVIVVVNFHLR